MRTLLALVAGAALLSACGLRGDLVRPMPLWGDPPNEGVKDPRTIKAAEDAAAAEKAKKEADKKAADEARRQLLEEQSQQAVPMPEKPQ
jgi:hypothetical protein